MVKIKRLLPIIFIVLILSVGVMAWYSTYFYRYQIFENTTSFYTKSINDTYGINGDIIWALTNNDSYIYSTETGTTGTITIANNTDEKYWENETTHLGNEPHNIWNSGEVFVSHMGDDVNDSTLYNLNYTVKTPALVNGVFGYGREFLGNTLTFLDASQISVTKNLSLCAWINTAGIVGDGYIIYKNNAAAGYYFELNNVNLRFLIRNSTVTMYRTSTGSIKSNVWVFVCGTYETNNVLDSSVSMKLYANGTEIAGTNTGNIINIADGLADLNIGSSGGGGGSINGNIDEVRIYNRTLTSTEILNMYNNGINQLTRLGSESITPTLFNWTSPVANISTGAIGDGLQFNSTYTWSGLGTVYNISAVFNNTVYAPTLVSGTTYTYAMSLPTVSTATNIEYYYSANVLYGGTDYIVNSTHGTVAVSPVSISNCSSGTPIFRFDVFDEETPLSTLTAKFYGTFRVYSSYPTSYSTFNVTLQGNTTHFICILPNTTSNIRIDADIRYDNESYYYPPRYYFMRNRLIDNVTDQINLYLLNSTYATNIQFQVINSNNIVQPDVLVSIDRYYEDSGLYRTVAMGVTADDGYTNIRLRPYDIYYRPIVSRNGTVLRTFTPIILTTVQNILTISEDEVGGYWQYNNNIMHSCTFTNATGILQCDAVVTTGESLTFKLEAWEILPVSTDTICAKEAYGSSVTILCDLGNMTGRKATAKFWAEMTTNHDPLDDIDINMDFGGEFGTYGLLFMAMLIMTMVMVSLYNPAVALIACFIAIILGLSLNLMSISTPAVISIILVIIIGIYKVRS